jgi:hypothetical protein
VVREPTRSLDVELAPTWEVVDKHHARKGAMSSVRSRPSVSTGMLRSLSNVGSDFSGSSKIILSTMRTLPSACIARLQLRRITAERSPDHDHRRKTTARTARRPWSRSSRLLCCREIWCGADHHYGDRVHYNCNPWLLCVYSTAGLQSARLGAFERYGEVLSGAFIALVGVALWLWPVL